MLKHIDYQKARELLQALPVHERIERVPLLQALDRVLAEEVCAPFDVPPFDKSPFDGYALRAQDVPGRLPLVGESSAGASMVPALTPGTAMRIFTGARIPEGADLVVKQEDARGEEDTVIIPDAYAPGHNIIRAGEDLACGECVARRGDRLSPADLGMLASLGVAAPAVFARPRAVLFNTGSELAEPGEPLPPNGIFNSNRYVLTAYLTRMGFEVESPPILRDDRDLIAREVEHAMDSGADIVITTGGASVGDYDFSLYAAERMGAEILFWKLNMKPGGAMLAATRGGKLYLGLSGNPAAAIMGILVAVQPYLQKLCGAAAHMEEILLPLEKDLPKTSSAVRLLRGHLTVRDGQALFTEHSGRGNGMIRSFDRCDLIGIIPGGGKELPAGTVIRALRLPPYLC